MPRRPKRPLASLLGAPLAALECKLNLALARLKRLLEAGAAAQQRASLRIGPGHALLILFG